MIVVFALAFAMVVPTLKKYQKIAQTAGASYVTRPAPQSDDDSQQLNRDEEERRRSP